MLVKHYTLQLLACPFNSGKFIMLIYLKTNLFEKFFCNTSIVSYSLDPDQARHFVGPDLVPSSLPKISADNSRSFTP